MGSSPPEVKIPDHVNSPRTWWVWAVMAAAMAVGYAVLPDTVWVTNAVLFTMFGVSQFFTERTQTKMLRSTYKHAYQMGWIEHDTHTISIHTQINGDNERLGRAIREKIEATQLDVN